MGDRLEYRNLGRWNGMEIEREVVEPGRIMCTECLVVAIH